MCKVKTMTHRDHREKEKQQLLETSAFHLRVSDSRDVTYLKLYKSPFIRCDTVCAILLFSTSAVLLTVLMITSQNPARLVVFKTNSRGG